MSTPVTDALAKLLANHQVLYQKLRGYHWNVTGDDFFELHAKFEELYDATAETVDELAERIVALGGHPPSSLQAQLALATLKEDNSTPAAAAMVAAIAADYEQLAADVIKTAELAGEHHDRVSENLMDDLIGEIEKTRWMLRAYLSR